jgi:ACS family glucarate transporter-like MFS transporter
MRHASSSREILLWMIAASAVNFFGRTSIAIAGPEIMKQFGISPVQMGAVYSSFAAAYALTMVPAGPLSDRFGARRVLGIAGIVSAVCLFAAGLSSLAVTASALLSLLAVFRFLFGISSAPLYTACAKVTANWYPPFRFGRIQGIVVGAGALGSTAAPVVITFLMLRFGWPAAFYAGAVATAAVFTAWLLRVRNNPARISQELSEPIAKSSSWSALLRNRQILLLALSYFAVGYVYDLFDYWTYYYFREVRQFGESRGAVFTSAAQLTAMVAMPLGGWLSDAFASRWLPSMGRRTVPLGSLTLSALCLLVGSAATEAAVAVSFFCAAFGFAAAVEGAYWATVIELGGEHTGLAYGFVNVGGNLGGFVSPLVLPIVAARFGWNSGLMLTSTVALAAAASWLFLGRTPAAVAAKQVTIPANPIV